MLSNERQILLKSLFFINSWLYENEVVKKIALLYEEFLIIKRTLMRICAFETLMFIR